MIFLNEEYLISEKNVEDAWKKHQNPNHFGGWPVVDGQGKIVSISITAYGHVAKLFEEEGIQKRLEEAFRRNNLEYTGFEDQELENGIKKGVKSKVVPEPPLPIFLMKSYALQSYLSTLMR